MHEIPEGWEWKRVHEVGEVQLGRQRSPEHENGPHMRPYLRVANVFDSRIDYSDVLKMNFTPSEFKKFSLRQDDILLNEGQSLELVGRSAIYKGPPGICFQNTLIRFRARDVLPQFAQAVFRQWLDTGEFRKIAKQTTSIAHLGADRFANMLFPVPPIATQWKIAETIESIDAQVDAARNIINKVSAIGFGLKSHWMRQILEEGQRYPKRTLSEVAQIASGITLGSEPSGSGTIRLPYLRVANVQDGYIDTSEMKTIHILRNEVSRYLLAKGDVLLTEGGDFDKLGRGAVWDARIPECASQNHIFRVRCNQSYLIPEYLAAYTSSQYGKRYFLSIAKQTTNLATINSTQLKAMPIPLPSLTEQRVIVSALEAHTSRMRSEEGQLKQLLLINKGVTEDLLTGRTPNSFQLVN